MILDATPAARLDDSAHDFISTFISHVALIHGDDENRMAVVARVETLLLAALASDDSASSAWSMLHRAITEIVKTYNVAHTTRSAYAYLHSFLRENTDLAYD